MVPHGVHVNRTGAEALHGRNQFARYARNRFPDPGVDPLNRPLRPRETQGNGGQVSSQTHETTLELHADVAEPLLQARRLRLTRRSAGLLAGVGRYGVVWLPVYALLTGEGYPLAKTALLASVVALVWFLMLRSAFGAARLTLLSLGSAIAAGLGTLTGLVAVSAVTLWAPSLQISPV